LSRTSPATPKYTRCPESRGSRRSAYPGGWLGLRREQSRRTSRNQMKIPACTACTGSARVCTFCTGPAQSAPPEQDLHEYAPSAQGQHESTPPAPAERASVQLVVSRRGPPVQTGAGVPENAGSARDAEVHTYEKNARGRTYGARALRLINDYA